jgi:hypothetical protein
VGRRRTGPACPTTGTPDRRHDSALVWTVGVIALPGLAGGGDLLDDADQGCVGAAVGGGDQPTDSRVQGLPVQSCDNATRGLAQSDPGGEMHAVTELTFGHVGGAPSGRNPG